MAINQLTSIPEVPALGTPAPTFSSMMFAAYMGIKNLVASLNVVTSQINSASNNCDTKSSYASERAQVAFDSAANASAASIVALSAKNGAQIALQATLDAAGEVGALDLLNARKAVKRQKANFFKLNPLA